MEEPKTVNSKFLTGIVVIVAVTTLCSIGKISGDTALVAIMIIAGGYTALRTFTKGK